MPSQPLALVTGSAQRLGKAFALALARMGFSIALHYRGSADEAEHTVKELIFPINKLVSLHKIPSKNPLHWFSLAIGILLFFMAVSSFWMFTTRSKQFRKGMYTALAGIVFAVILLLFI